MRPYHLITRPWSFTVSAMPVIVTVAYLCWAQPGSFDWLNAVLALVVMVSFHAAGNMLSDYYDYKQGVDRNDTLNGVTWILDGTFKPEEIRRYALILMIIPLLVGLWLLYRVGFEFIWFGVLGLIFALGYSWFKYHVLGDLMVLLAFSLLPSLGTAYVFTGEFNWFAVLISVSYGLYTVAVLHSNDTRDICNDRRAAISTLATKVGSRWSHVLYYVEVIIPYLLVLVCSVIGILPWISFLVFITLPVAVKNIQQMRASGFEEAMPIAGLDQQTAQLHLLFSLSLLVSLVFGAVFMQ